MATCPVTQTPPIGVWVTPLVRLTDGPVACLAIGRVASAPDPPLALRRLAAEANASVACMPSAHARPWAVALPGADV